jgi:hypothetical protein
MEVIHDEGIWLLGVLLTKRTEKPILEDDGWAARPRMRRGE